MIIKIEDAGFVNKGATLMLFAIIDKLKNLYGSDLICVVDDEIGNRFEKASLNLYQEGDFQRFRIPNLIPTSQMLKYNLVNPKDIKLVLNASGFSLGDQWQPYPKEFFTKKLNSYPIYKKNGAKIIYLPQAYGPFTTSSLINHIRKIEIYVDLFYARDVPSFNYLKNQFLNNDNIIHAPDFTNIYEVKKNNYYNNYFVIIPNHRIIEKTKIANKNYTEVLKHAAIMAYSRGLKILFLNHEGILDRKIIDEVVQMLDFKVKIEDCLPPDQIKAIIKAAFAVMSSRYHGVVSALSQGIPVAVMGWSHKYEELMKDYNAEEFLINCDLTKETIGKLEKILNSKENDKIRKTLDIYSENQKLLTQNMWKNINSILKD